MKTRIKITIAILICLFVQSQFAFAQTNSVEPANKKDGTQTAEVRKKAQAAYDKGDYAETVKLITPLINDYFTSDVYSNDLFLRAKAYFKLDKNKEALADLKIATDEKNEFIGKSLDKNELANRYALQGDSYRKYYDYKPAIESYGKALKLNAKLPDIYQSRGELNLDEENYSAARNDFNEAIKLNPKLTAAYLHRGYVFSYDEEDEDTSNQVAERSNYKAALADFDKVLKLDPKNTNAMNARGYIYFKQKKKDAAIAEFKKVLAIKPDNELAKANLDAIKNNKPVKTIIQFLKLDDDEPYFS